jgi:hypothetical protein
LEARSFLAISTPIPAATPKYLGARALKRHAGEPEVRQPERDGSLAAQRLPEGDEDEPV